MSDVTSVVYLKTVAGRTCTVTPPFTLQRLIAAAADELKLQRESVKLCANGKLLHAVMRSDDMYKRQRQMVVEEEAGNVEVAVPESGVILVVGKPNYPKINTESKKLKEWTTRGVKPADGVVVGSGMFIDSTMEGTVTTPLPAVVRRKVAESKSNILSITPTVNTAPTGDDNYIQSNSTESRMYRFLKPFVFLRGKRSLAYLLDTIKKEYVNAPELVRDHPLMVSIVEYVNCDPIRLKEVLTTIQEEEPELFTWIKRNTDFFLSVINAHPFWRDGSSPMWLIRYARGIYLASSESISSVSDLSRRILETYQHHKTFMNMYSSTLAYMVVSGGLLSLDNSLGNSDVLPPSQMESKKKSACKDIFDFPSHFDEWLEDDSLPDPCCKELELLYRTWEIGRERWRSVLPGSSEKFTTRANLQSLLHDIYGTLMRYMEYFLLAPPTPGVLAKFNELGQKFWNEGEEWHVEQKDISHAFESALGLLLFNAGNELIKVQMDVYSNKGKCFPKTHLAVFDEHENSPLLDPTIRWITSSGPYVLAHELEEYSIKQNVIIVIYTLMSGTRASAYVITKGKVHIAPITMDIKAANKFKKLESLYNLLEGKHPQEEEKEEEENEEEEEEGEGEGEETKEAVINRWNTLMCSFYERYITPIEHLLPPAATQIHDTLSWVSEVCFIHTWAPKHAPIPFPALQSRDSSLRCALKWAPFIAHRPWDLILSSEVPWSAYATKMPTITRISDTVVVTPSTVISEEPVSATTNMVVYVNINDIGCSTPGRDLPKEKNTRVSQANTEELWRYVPWEKFLGRALGGVCAGVPTHAFLYGKYAMETCKTALLIHEVVRAPDGWRRCETEVKTSKNSLVSCSSRSTSLLRGVPFNQNADLFVSHVLGRETGVGIHRAALMPIFGVSGEEPIETYNYFFNSLISTEDMTTAKAYRLALLLSWESEYKSEPWRPASVALLNYGGPMQTLKYLHKMYWEKRHVETLRPRKIRHSNSEETVEGGMEQTKGAARRAVRDVMFSKYVEQHSIDSIFGVMMQEIDENKPVNRVSVFDAMINALERNRESLKNVVRERTYTRPMSLGGTDSPPVAQVVTPAKPTGARGSFVTSVRNMVASCREDKGAKALRSVNISGNDKPPYRERQPPGGK